MTYLAFNKNHEAYEKGKEKHSMKTKQSSEQDLRNDVDVGAIRQRI